MGWSPFDSCLGDLSHCWGKVFVYLLFRSNQYIDWCRFVRKNNVSRKTCDKPLELRFVFAAKLKRKLGRCWCWSSLQLWLSATFRVALLLKGEKISDGVVCEGNKRIRHMFAFLFFLHHIPCSPIIYMLSLWLIGLSKHYFEKIDFD